MAWGPRWLAAGPTSSLATQFCAKTRIDRLHSADPRNELECTVPAWNGSLQACFVEAN